MSPYSVLLDNPALKDIAPEKLKFLLEFSTQNANASAKDMMSILMSAKSTAQNQGMNFSSDEMNLIFEILKQHMSEQERAKADMIITLFQKMSKKN